MSGRLHSRLLWAILLIAVALRLIAVIARLDQPLSGDEPSYDRIASHLVAGEGYVSSAPGGGLSPTALRGPAYVLLIAACHWLFGPSPVPVHVVQVILDTLSLLLIYRLARNWFPHPAVAIGAAALYAVYPPFILSTASLLTETFTLFTLLTATVLFFEYLERRGARFLVGSAVALGLCALTKPQVAPVGVILCVAAIPRLGLAKALRAAAMVVLVVTLVMSPWIVRNAVAFQRFVPGLSTGGLGLWFGAGPVNGRTIGGLGDPLVPDSLRDAVANMSEMAVDRWALAEAKRLIAADPAGYAVLTFKKVFRLWFNLGFDGVRPSRATLLVATFHVLAIGLALFGARRATPDPAGALYMGLMAVFWTIANVPFVAIVRYSYPFYALLFTFTAAGAWALASQWRLPGSRQQG